MKLSKKDKERIDGLIKIYCPYVNVGELLWQREDGEIEFIKIMETSHIEACYRKIKKDKTFIFDTQAQKVIFPLLDKKLDELKQELSIRLESL